MKAFLLHRDRDFDLQAELPPNAEALTEDLELGVLFDAMALDDPFLRQVAQRVVLRSMSDPEAIVYRQEILKDALQNNAIVREIYSIAVAAMEGERKSYYGLLSRYPDLILHRSLEVLQMFLDLLRKLRGIAHEHAQDFASAGFTALFAMLEGELGDEYLANIQDHLKALRFRHGMLISAGLGEGNKGTGYTLRKPRENRQGWIRRITARRPPAYTFYIDERDDSGARALSELRDRGINSVANALAQSVEHILHFFTMLRAELAFYVGCLNLQEQLAQMGEPVTFPVSAAPGERRHSFRGLYDACLALTMKRSVVGNDMLADQKDLVIITGANQGGKSTFLRSIGLAQLMMQCGMFVPAESFCASVCEGLFTHYKREEDVGMGKGKLDEELNRMSAIADNVRAHSLVLFNESFAATNEREGSAIAGQIIRALLDAGVRVYFVTHQYTLAHGLHGKGMPNALFLRAERAADGTRTFRLVEGEPLETSYGVDLYERVFGAES